jgi:hypothetical protein
VRTGAGEPLLNAEVVLGDTAVVAAAAAVVGVVADVLADVPPPPGLYFSAYSFSWRQRKSAYAPTITHTQV